MAAESLILDRIELGEEMDMNFVESTVTCMLDVWNTKLLELKQRFVEVHGPEILTIHDSQIQDGDENEDIEETQVRIGNAMAAALDELAPCNISKHPEALRLLALQLALLPA